jgi:hypothetical protein
MKMSVLANEVVFDRGIVNKDTDVECQAGMILIPEGEFNMPLRYLVWVA